MATVVKIKFRLGGGGGLPTSVHLPLGPWQLSAALEKCYQTIEAVYTLYPESGLQIILTNY